MRKVETILRWHVLISLMTLGSSDENLIDISLEHMDEYYAPSIFIPIFVRQGYQHISKK